MRSPFLFLVLLTGCPDPTGKETGGGDDTGEPIVYEEGCITIDGGGGYAHLADAITLASEGAVIELCDGTYEEAVTVDKGVTIRGASVDGTFLTGPGSDVPLTITGANVTIENLVIDSPRTGIDLDGAADAVLSSITVASAGSWGISASNSTASITDITIVEPAAGGIEVSGGEIAVSNATIEYPGGFGVDISDDAVVALDATTITGTLMLSDDVTDGFAVSVTGATLDMTASTIDGAEGMGIYGDDAELNLTDTTLSAAVYFGIYAFDTTFDISGLTITGTVLQGIYADGPSLTMSSSSIEAVPEESCSYIYEEWASKYGPWCGGVIAFADAVTFTDVNVSGWNNYGYYVLPYDDDLTTLSITGGVIDNVGRWGTYLYTTEGTVSGLTVSNMREPELEDPCGGYIDQSVGFLPVYSDLEVDSLTIQDNAGWGMSSVGGTNAITNSTFDGNGCAGLMNYQSSLTIESSTFSNGTQYGGLYDYGGATVATGNTFSDNRSGYYYEYESGGVTYAYEYDGGYGQDVLAIGSGAVVLTGNTFTGGDDSIYASEASSLEISGNTWSDYDGVILYSYYADEESPAIFSDNTVDDFVGPVVSNTYGYVEVDNVTVGTSRTATVAYTSYVDGVEDYSYSYTTSSYGFSSSGYYYDDGTTVTEYPAGMTLTDVTVTSSYSTLVSVSDASLEVDNLVAESVGGYAVYGSWSGYAPEVDVEGLTVGTAAYTALYMYNSSLEAGAASFSDVTVDAVTSGDGVYTQGLGALTLTDVAFGSVSSDGVQTISRGYDYEYVYDEDTGSYTVYYTDVDAETQLDATNLSILDAGTYGLYLQGGAANLSGVTIENAGGTGVYVQGLTDLTLSDVTITAPGTVGISSSDSYSYYSYEDGANATADGDTVATLTSVSVVEAVGAAYIFEGGTTTISGSSGTSAGASGLVLVETTADVQGNTFTDNTEYGMTCETVTLSACATNDLTGNTLGTHSGCADSCGE